MRTATFPGENVITIVDVDRPRPGPDQVLMEVAYCGLCGSERRQLQQGSRTTPGHEVSGVVVESEAADVPVGTRAVGYLPIFCGECCYCTTGQTNRCINWSDLIGWSDGWPGGYAEYMVLPARNVVKIEDQVALDQAVLLLDTIGTALHAVRLADPRGSRALVMGAGPLGLGAVAGLMALGAAEVFASDPIAYRRDAAANLGAKSIEPKDVGELDSVDVIIEAAGRAETTTQAIEMVAPGGRVVMMGENWDPWTYKPTVGNMLKDSSLIRSWYFPLSEFAENQQLLLEGHFPSDPLISHTFALDDLESAFRRFFGGESTKVLCRP